MCTSIIYSSGNHYFGRNLDLEISFGEKVVITPRNYEFKYRKLSSQKTHHAIIGMAIINNGYPLYFDAANEQGLGMAGLNFDGPCHYNSEVSGKNNVTPFEFIPYVLGSCSNISEAKKLIAGINLVKINFSEQFQLSPLHWLIADREGKSITVESTIDGLHVYDNPVGSLTNNPEFPKQLLNLSNYQSVSPAEPINTLAPNIQLDTYSRGLGSHNLPGGMDSESRFVKVVFTKEHAPQGKDEVESVTNYFHILHAVEQQKGLDEVAPDTFEYTIYSDCMNLEKGIFYYTTYSNNQINAVDLNKVDLSGQDLISYELVTDQKFNFQN